MPCDMSEPASFGRRAALRGLASLALVPGLAQGQAPQPQPLPQAQELLEQADRARNPGQAFTFTNSMTEFKNGQPVYGARFHVMSKTDRRSSQYRNLVTFVAPAEDIGKRLLLGGEVLWFFDPGSGSTVRVSPQQRLQGQVSNGDVLTLNLAHDYAATAVSDDSILDDQQARRRARKLVLEARSDIAIYARIEYWIDAANLLPIKGRYFADSGKLLKTIYFSAYKPVLGGTRPTEMTVIDEFDPSRITKMVLADFAAADIPDVRFQRQFLSKP